VGAGWLYRGEDALCVYSGGATGALTAAAGLACWFAAGSSGGLGALVSAAADVDGAGTPGLLAADPIAEAGAVYLLAAGAPSGSVADAAIGEIDGAGSRSGPEDFGLAAAVVGDLDGDGVDEVVAEGIEGAWLARGPVAGRVSRADLEAIGAAWTFGSAGDTDGDGLQDLWVGGVDAKSPSTGGFAVWAGPVDVTRGPAGTWAGEADTLATRAAATDLDGDGRGDLVGLGGGVVYGLYGPFAGVADLSCAARVGAFTGTELVAAVGDLDGDALPELLIGTSVYAGGALW
jgi:hypothetical protein